MPAPYARSREGVRPIRRFDVDAEPFVLVRWQEAPDDNGAPDEGAAATIETINLADLPGGVDTDPANPQYREVSTDASMLTEGWLRFEFEDADGATNLTAWSQFDDADSSPDGAYCTANELRTDLELSSSDLTDTAANRIIADACDLIDSELGARCIDETTGRKVVQDDVETWQWDKLNRATRALAVILQKNPQLASSTQYDRVKGPDFEYWGRQGSAFGLAIGALLDASQLRRLTTTVGPRRDRPPWYSFSYGTTED